MNIQNISALAEQLQLLGFDNAGYQLLKRICFNPENFVFTRQVKKANEELIFQLFYQKHSNQDIYVLMYYDAILQTEIAAGERIINDIEIAPLESKMTEVDWKKAFDFTENKHWAANDKTSWENELKIATVMDGLTALSVTDEGKAIAESLKLKYWNGSAYYEVFDNITQPKGRAEISQRFYFSDIQTGISVDEAYRFLQNRKLEKMMQSKRRQVAKSEEEQHGDGANSTSGSGLLKKRRLNGGARTKKSKATAQ
jgi:hypothetical protein